MNLNSFFSVSPQTVPEIFVRPAEKVSASNNKTMVLFSKDAEQFLSQLNLRVDTKKALIVDNRGHDIFDLSQHPGNGKKFSFVSLGKKDQNTLSMRVTYKNGGNEDFTLSKQALQKLKKDHNH